MTLIKKLFLTLSLLAMQSAFGMDPVTKKARTGSDEWTLITCEKAFARLGMVGRFVAINTAPFGDQNDDPNTDQGFGIYSVNPFEPEDNDHIDPSLYNLVADIGDCDLLSSRVSCQEPWKVRGLTLEEARTVKLGEKNDYRDAEDNIVVPDEIRLKSLTRRAQTCYIVQHYLKQSPQILLGIHKFRHSALDPLPKDVARLICKLKIVDVRSENPVVRSVE
ncbi:MAG TPA: hypothetical protein VLH77_06165 [Gammaproteobacteria bacterium]|nr:hypothetical protein [Gammaproteobacteria bacterium]